MAGADGKDGVMTAAELKPLLLLSKREPVNCAIGLTRDKQGVILLDKRAKPRKVASLLKKATQAKKIELDANTVRFGKASVDADRDSSLVVFTVNKDASGALRVKLLEQLKKAGFSKCEITVDAALEDEPDEETGEKAGEDAPGGAAGTHGRAGAGGAPPAGVAPAAASAEPAASPLQAADAAATPPAAQNGAAPEQAPPDAHAPDAHAPDAHTADAHTAGARADAAAGTQDADALRAKLTGLVKTMIAALGSNPPGADAMKTAAMAAQASLKSGDLASAAKGTETLERMLGSSRKAAAGSAGPAAGAGAGRHPMGSPVFGKARDAWVATRAKVQGEVDKLFHDVSDSLKGHGAAPQFAQAFKQKIAPAMAQLDHSLSAKLDEVAKNTEPGQHGKLVGEAQQILTKYQSYLSSETMFAELDRNPFQPLAVGKTLQASLGALGQALQAPANGKA